MASSASSVSLAETNTPTSTHLFTMGDFAVAALKVAQAQGTFTHRGHVAFAPVEHMNKLCCFFM